MKKLYILILIFTFFLTACNSEKSEDVFYNNEYNVVEVKATTMDGEYESFGSGILLYKDGTILTNSHIITYESLGIYVLYDNISIKFYGDEEYKACEIVKYDVNKDIAILKSGYVKEAEDINISKRILDFNDTIYSIGNFNNYGLSLTKGIISCPSINIEYLNETNSFIQADITVSNGNSGGGLFDEDGNLIGMVTFRLKDNKNVVIQGICYCIPIDRCITYLNEK